jgi:hypothetical protein
MSDIHRVVLNENAYNALKAEAIVRQTNLKDTLEFMILENLSPNGKDVLNIIETKKSKPSAVHGKIFENKAALEDLAPMPAPRARHGGKPPLEETDPQLAQEILLYYGGGKRRGGHSRNETAEHFGVGDGQVDKLVRRSSEKKQK